jgi:iron complex transport system substrate-binding protein
MTWDDPLTAAGPNSYAGQLLELCGATNIISDVSARYPPISHEVLLARNPDVIIAAAMTSRRWTVESLYARTGWENLKAVQQGRLHLLDGDAVSRCGPRLVEVLEAMAHAIYPDRFAAPPPERGVADGNGDGRPTS